MKANSKYRCKLSWAPFSIPFAEGEIYTTDSEGRLIHPMGGVYPLCEYDAEKHFELIEDLQPNSKYRCKKSFKTKISETPFVEETVYETDELGHLKPFPNHSYNPDPERVAEYFELVKEPKLTVGKWYIPYVNLKLAGIVHFVKGKPYQVKAARILTGETGVNFSFRDPIPGVMNVPKWVNFFKEEYLPEAWAVKIDNNEVVEGLRRLTGKLYCIANDYYIHPESRLEAGLPVKYELIPAATFQRLVVDKLLPEKWAVKRTKENAGKINEWAKGQDNEGYGGETGYMHSEDVDYFPFKLSLVNLKCGFIEIPFEVWEEKVYKPWKEKQNTLPEKWAVERTEFSASKINEWGSSVDGRLYTGAWGYVYSDAAHHNSPYRHYYSLLNEDFTLIPFELWEEKVYKPWKKKQKAFNTFEQVVNAAEKISDLFARQNNLKDYPKGTKVQQVHDETVISTPVYILRKDLPGLKAGAEFHWVRSGFRHETKEGEYAYTKEAVESETDWFRKKDLQDDVIAIMCEQLKSSKPVFTKEDMLDFGEYCQNSQVTKTNSIFEDWKTECKK